MTEQRKQRLRRILQGSRFRLLSRYEEFAEPLRDMIYVATQKVYRISTNGKCIYFNPDWLQRLDEESLDFILAHQLMHLYLGHIERSQLYKGDRFHLACDIVANSHLEKLGIYSKRYSGIGRIYTQTFYPVEEGRALTAEQAFFNIPFDPSALPASKRKTYMIDSEEWWDHPEDDGRSGEIVLSPDDVDPHGLLPKKEEPKRRLIIKRRQAEDDIRLTESSSLNAPEMGDHTEQAPLERTELEEKTLKNLRMQKRKESATANERMPYQRSWQRSGAGVLNWRRVLNRFVQEEVCDYSFTPPDRRFADSDFFLPDYNVSKEQIQEVWFMVDTSGSVNNETLSLAYNELEGALVQFDGALSGVLAFFDTRVYPPVPFRDIEVLEQMPLHGGGGTEFGCIFDYIRKNTGSDRPTSIVIFTDGKGEFPKESEANGIPVLWLFTNLEATAPWGEWTIIKNSV